MNDDKYGSRYLIIGLILLITLFLVSSCSSQPQPLQPTLTGSTDIVPPPGNESQRTATPTLIPFVQNTSTHTVTPEPTTTKQPSATIEATPTSTAFVIPLAEDDPLLVDMTAKGYILTSSGSFSGPEQFIYSALVFIQPETSPSWGSSEVNDDTVQVAFYRWGGEQNQLISIHRFPKEIAGPPVAAAIINWQQPFYGSLVMDSFYHPDERITDLLGPKDFLSDLNQNGLPEFSFYLEYCPTSCTHPEFGVQLFEIRSPSSVVNLTPDLPGLTRFEIHTEDPFTFYVEDAAGYDIYVSIDTNWIYVWDGSNFIDISAQFSEYYLSIAEPYIDSVQVDYGNPFEYKLELATLKILKLYEKAGMTEQGLTIFLELTDPIHWPESSSWSMCWLQMSRATIREDFRLERTFSMPLSSSFLEYRDIALPYIEPLEQAGYDMSFCQAILP